MPLPIVDYRTYKDVYSLRCQVPGISRYLLAVIVSTILLQNDMYLFWQELPHGCIQYLDHDGILSWSTVVRAFLLYALRRKMPLVLVGVIKVRCEFKEISVDKKQYQ